MRTAKAFFFFFFIFGYISGGYAAYLNLKWPMLGLMAWNILGMAIAMIHGQRVESQPRPGARLNRR